MNDRIRISENLLHENKSLLRPSFCVKGTNPSWSQNMMVACRTFTFDLVLRARIFFVRPWGK